MVKAGDSRVNMIGSVTWELHKDKKTNFYAYNFKVQSIRIGEETYTCSFSLNITTTEEVEKCYLLGLNGHFTIYNNKPAFKVRYVSMSDGNTNPEDAIARLKIKNLGVKTVKKIVEMYPYKTLDKLKDPNALSKVSGISVKKAINISTEYKKRISTQNLFELADEYHLPDHLSKSLLNKYKEDAYYLLKDNAYILLGINGMDLERCDKIATEEQCLDYHSLQRLEAILLYLLEKEEMRGHSYIDRDDLVQKSLILANADYVDTKITREEVLKAINSSRRKKEIRTEDDKVYSYYTYWQEINVKNCMLQIANSGKAETETEEVKRERILEEIAKFEEKEGILLEENQKAAVIETINNKNGLILLNGAAGTGKTTTIKCIIYIYKQLINDDSDIILTAPTGRAAKRMVEATGHTVNGLTIHRLLEYHPDGGFTRNRFNPLTQDLIIIDEASMINLSLADDLFSAIHPRSRVVVVGDPEQLSNIGIGEFFRDVIMSNVFKTIRLRIIKRQKELSGIVEAATNVKERQPLASNNITKDFYLATETQVSRIKSKIISAVERLIEKKGKLDEVQVVIPQKTGPVGTYQVNREIQKIFNPASPEKKEMSCEGNLFRVGDRVIHTVNNYKAKHFIQQKNNNLRETNETGVFNGEIGKVIQITAENELVVQYDGHCILYKGAVLRELQLAYALTVHKLQGSQAKNIISVLSIEHRRMLSKRLAYTMLTRAEDFLFLITDDIALEIIRNINETDTRRTTLKERIIKGKIENEWILERMREEELMEEEKKERRKERGYKQFSFD